MMLKGADLSQRISFSVSSDKENPTVFILRPLSGIEMMEMAKYVDGEKLVLSRDYILAMLGKSIVEIKNPGVVDPAAILQFVESLDSTSVMEIVSEVGKINKFSGQDEKN